MNERMVDRNGLRGGAAISALLLVIAFLLDFPGIVAAVTAALGVGALFGVRTSPLGWAYRQLKKLLGLKIDVELEPEAPPRFAQLLGFLVSGLGLALLLTGADAIGWVCVLAVAALQTLLAVTGICVGCEMYLIGKRLGARGA